MLTDAEKSALLKAARRSVEGAPDEAVDVPGNGAAFVSLHTRDAHQLRGCIGNFSFDTPLVESVRRMARAAAFDDTRFSPVRPEELTGLKLEISALTKPAPIKAEDVVIGKHGLLISRGGRRGVFLPQVPVEWRWTRDEYLRQLCRKAGLPDDAWRDPTTRLEAFEAEVFSEP